MRLVSAGSGAAVPTASSPIPEQPQQAPHQGELAASPAEAPPSPDELERRYNASTADKAATIQEEQEEEPAAPVIVPQQLTAPRLLNAFSKMFRAIMVYPGLEQPVEVAGAVTKISQISISAHQSLKEHQIHVPLTTINELIADQWTASLFRQGELAPEISSDWVISAFIAANPLATECSKELSTETEYSTFLSAVSSLALPLEQYQMFVSQITGEKLNIDTGKLYLSLAQHFYSSVDGLVKTTSLSNPECKMALYRVFPDVFQSVWADWRDRIFTSTKKLDSASDAYQYLLNLSEGSEHAGFPLRQVKDDCHEVLRRVVDSTVYVLGARK
ncbi:hypothetical protein AADX40_15165 [Aeromonas veronii]|uniref:hypothetical protein n=1 Tax=Aeromonas veronii TaxID=654 RepID=UPI0031596B34